MDGCIVYRNTKLEELNAAESWLPSLFCSQAGRVARLAAYSRRVGDVAQKCLDGWRTSPDLQSVLYDPLSENSPRYRQANISVFFLNIEMHHCQRPIVENRPYCVIPGDVLVPRIPPLHACLVSESNHRHPIDGNCFLVRGMKPVDAAWLLALLNEKEFESWFVARSGSWTLPRIGLRDLRNCPFPEPPEGILEWSTRLLDWVEKFTSNATRLFALQSEISGHVFESLSDEILQKYRLFPGVREPASLLSSDSLLPGHVENEYQQRLLKEKGLLRLKDLAQTAASGFNRLKDGHASRLHVLTLRDVADIYIPLVELSSPETRLGRFFSEPVSPGEVLISSLVTNPKIAYADPNIHDKIHPIDHWLRLRFRETPGAWALVLSSPAVSSQLGKLATGSAQQFTKLGSLMELYVPNIDSILRFRWQNRLDELLADRRRLDEEWKAIRLDGRRMVAKVLDIPWRDMQERSLK
jgi:hypothetical protein